MKFSDGNYLENYLKLSWNAGEEIYWVTKFTGWAVHCVKLKRFSLTRFLWIFLACACVVFVCYVCLELSKRMKTETRIVWAVCGVCVFSFLVFTRMKVKLLKSSINYFTPIGWPPVLAKSGVSLMVKICHNESRLFWIAPDRICGLNHS